MIRRMIATPGQLDRVLAGPNAFSECPPADRATLRAILDRQRPKLAVYDLKADLPFADRQPPHGNLYCVLKGCFSLQWDDPNGRSLAFLTCSEGALFGEFAPGLLDLPLVDFGLHATPLASRTCRMARLLEFPKDTVTELLKNRHFHGRLADTAVARLCDRVGWLPLRHDPTLATAHFCVSPMCGINLEFHPTLRYLGNRVTVAKTLTFEELARMTGFVINTVRNALDNLEELGYLHAVSDPILATRVSVERVDALVDGLRLRTLTDVTDQPIT